MPIYTYKVIGLILDSPFFSFCNGYRPVIVASQTVHCTVSLPGGGCTAAIMIRRLAGDSPPVMLMPLTTPHPRRCLVLLPPPSRVLLSLSFTQHSQSPPLFYPSTLQGGPPPARGKKGRPCWISTSPPLF